MRPLISALVVLSFMSGSSRAGDVCKDMYRFARAPGFYPDGTGKDGKAGARNLETTQLFVGQAEERVRPKIRNYFSALFKRKDLKDFRRTVVNAFGLDCDVECKRMIISDEFSGRVLANVLDGLTTLLLSELFADRDKLFVIKSKDKTRSIIEEQERIEDLTFLREHPFYKKAKETLRREILNELTLQDPDELIRSTFDKVRPLLIETVERMVPNEKDREFMVERLGSITFEGTDCTFGQPSSDESVMNALQFNASYDARSKTFKFCRGIVAVNQSEFTLVHIIAHELSHAIDPCGIAVGPGDYRFIYDSLKDPKLAANEYILCRV